MKKKLGCILTTIFLMLACVLVTACGNKYENLEFKIYYAYSANASENEWIDASNGISLNYRNENGFYLFEGQELADGQTGGVAKLYFKVEIANVKAKHVDLITASATSISGMNFSSVSVSQNQVFSIDVTGNVNTKLKFYENNSRKEASVDFVVSRTVDEIKADPYIKPAVLVNSGMAMGSEVNPELNLSILNNIKYYPLNKTNQTGVNYEIVEVGKYDADHTFVPSANQDLKNYITIEKGVLGIDIVKIGASFSVGADSYVVRIKATSKFLKEEDKGTEIEEKLTTMFDVYIVGDNDGAKPIAQYYNDNTNDNINNGTTASFETDANSKPYITLYDDAEGKYSCATIVTSLNISNVYMNNVYTSDGNVKYQPYIYINGEKYPLEKQGEVVDGLIFEQGEDVIIQNEDNENVNATLFNIRLAHGNMEDCEIKLAYELEGFDFSASSKQTLYETEFIVKKSILPKTITVNGEDYAHGDEVEKNIYSITNEGYLGQKLTIKATPSLANDETIYITTNDNIIITNAKGQEISKDATGYYIKSNTTVYVKFLENSGNSAIVTIKTKSTPEKFNGALVDVDNIEVEFEFKKVVTANKLSIYSDEDCTNSIESILVSNDGNSYVYVKAEHAAGTLNSSSLTARSSNSAIIFGNDKTEIAFNDFSIEQVSAVVDSYVVYKVPVKSLQTLEKSTITFMAGDASLNVNASLIAESVKLMSEDAQAFIKLTPTANRQGITDLTERVNEVKEEKSLEIGSEAFFAIAKNDLVELSVFDALGGAETITSISLTTDESGSAIRYNIIPNNAISIRGWASNQTAKCTLTVNFYAMDEESGVVSSTSITKVVYFAVYDPISNISVGKLTRDKISYVNSLFEESTTTEFTFRAYSSSGTPASSVTFGDIEILSVSQIRVGFDREISGQNIKVYAIIGGNEIEITGNGYVLIKGGVDYLSGTIKIKLTGSLDKELFKDLTINLTALRFGETSSVRANSKIKIAEIEKAASVSAAKDEINLSFLGKSAGETVSAEVKATVYYESLIADSEKVRFNDITFILYEYELDEDGKIVEENGNQQYNIADNRVLVSFVEVSDGVYNFTISANAGVDGGIFKLFIATKDSYSNNGYLKSDTLDILISDGKFVAYQLKDEADLNAIRADLDAKYVIAQDIEIKGDFAPIGMIEGGVAPFTGSLSGNPSYIVSGTTYRNSISIKIKESASSTSGTYGDLYGLFAILGVNEETGEKAIVKDLVINATFDSLSSVKTNGLQAGALAGVNKGIIENVLVNISGNAKVVSSSGPVSLGSMVGINEEIIKINGLATDFSGTISSAYNGVNNIGLIAGINNGSITGDYEGKESLDNINFNIISSLAITNNATSDINNYYIGGVAGANAGTIQGLLIGGSMIVADGVVAGVKSANGYLAGVAGKTTGEISTCAMLGLDLTSNIADGGVAVAGAVGETSADLTDVRYVSVYLKENATKGQLSGYGVIAGIAANATAGALTNITVENFIDTINSEEFFTFSAKTSGQTIAGLIATAGADIKESFIRANINANNGNVCLTGNGGAEENSYFIGKVKNSIGTTDYATYSIVNTEGVFNIQHSGLGEIDFSLYVNYSEASDITVENFKEKIAEGLFIDNVAYVKLDSTAEFDESQTYYVDELNSTEWNNFLSDKFSDLDNSKWEFDSNVNTVKLPEYPHINFNFPYLIDAASEAIMIIAPTDLYGGLNVDKIINIGSIYVDDYSKTEPVITETAIINFYVGGTAEGHNTYEIIDLVDLTIVPENATGGVRFEIYSGSQATINKLNEITFTDISWNTPIIVRAYSVFDVEKEEFFAFYTQAGFSALTLASNKIDKADSSDVDYDYLMNISTNGENTLITLGAENILKVAGKEFTYNDIFDYHNIKQHLKLEHDASDKFTINYADINSINFAIAETATFEATYQETITFTLKISKKYFGGTEEGYVNIGEVVLLVNVFNSASAVEILGSDHDIATDGTINLTANITTGFVDGQTAQKIENGIIQNGELLLDNSTKDNIKISFTCTENEAELNALLNRAGVNSIVELFDFFIYSSPIKASAKTVGYSYNITFSLKEDHDYRYIASQIKLNLIITALSEPTKYDSVSILLKPTAVSTAMIKNYAVKEINVNTDYTNLISTDNIETSIIEPGGKGSVFIITIDKSYAHFDKVTLTTSELYVPSLPQNVNLKFTQLYYDFAKNSYVTLTGSGRNNQEGNVLELSRISYEKDGKQYFNGVIYVHVQLAKFSGLESSIKATLNIQNEAGADVVSPYVKSLLTSYLPGVQLSSDALAVEGEKGKYYVQQQSYGNKVKIKAYGYQLNSNPSVKFGWSLVSGSEYFYSDLTTTISSAEEFQNATTAGSTIWYIDASNNKAYVATEWDNGVTYYVQDNDQDYQNIYKISDGTDTKYFIYNYLSYRAGGKADAVYNAGDNSYTVDVEFSLNKYSGMAIPASFKMYSSLTLVTSDGELYPSSVDSLTFYPTDYIVDSVYVKDLSSGIKRININGSTQFELEFETSYRYNDSISNEIYNKLVIYLSANNLSIAEYFSYMQNGESIKFSESEKHPEFTVSIYNDVLSVIGNAKFDSTIYFQINYSYEINANGVYELTFGGGSGVNKQLGTDFTFKILVSDSEEHATPIYTASDLFDANGITKLKKSQHYILMNDIVLDMAITPIDVAIGSFDGNNRVISITGFAVDTQKKDQTLGLFANIGTYEDSESATTRQTILKNVMVNYGSYESELALTGNSITGVTFGGLVAKNNGGLIYNCDVINLNQSINKTFSILVDNSTSVNVTFGGLVGVNSSNGVITNSRVGRSEYTYVSATESYTTELEKSLGKLIFQVLNSTASTDEANLFNIVAGGFIGENDGYISSSYLANTSLINRSNSTTKNLTAGFVGINDGSINYSYVKADESTITRDSLYASGSYIQHLGNGTVAGFVSENNGIISNSFANTELKTNSSYIAGFVFNNAGTVSESYAACDINADKSTVPDKAEQPFVGMSADGKYNASGKFSNVYYLTDATSTEKVKNVNGLDSTNFKDMNNLAGFVFIDSNVKSEREQGVWSYYTIDGEYHILPELNNANMIATSHRYLRSEENLTYQYSYALKYQAGTKNNPSIITNAGDFNKVFAPADSNSDTGYSTSWSGYARLINNINFNQDKTAIKTRINYTFGDAQNARTITSLDGNGMSISGIYLDIDKSSEVDSVGLFAKVENAYIKNVNLNYAKPTQETDNQFSTTTAMYSGGLAGKVNNSVIINVKLKGDGTTLTGKNFVGGLAGIITGSSLIYGIESNLYAKTGASFMNQDANGNIPDYLYYNEAEYNGSYSYSEYLTRMSFAGGIAGVVDITKRSGVEYNLSYITVRGDNMSMKTREGKQEANILADYAGGVAGYANENTNALRLKYYTGTNELIRGDKAAGGLFGVYLGMLTASQVTAEEDTQYKYDTELGKYIIALEKEQSTSSVNFANTETYGNLNLIESYKYAGGLIGVGAGATVTISYSKAGIKDGVQVGGLMGAAIASTVTYSYAVPFVNLTSNMKNVGGLFGSAYATSSSDEAWNSAQGVKTYEQLAIDNGRSELDTDIQFTFSTVLLNNSSLTYVDNNITNRIATKVDYICANYVNENNSNLALTSNRSTQLVYVYAGAVNYQTIGEPATDIVTNLNFDRCSTVDLNKLYDVTNGDHEREFQNVFSTWEICQYWSLNSNKYFPLLTDEKVDNRIIISTAEDFKHITNNPDGDFKIVADIDLSRETYKNWVIPKNFTGTIVGEIAGSNRKPKVYGMKLNPNLNDTAGFFLSTEYATISNVNFVWGVAGANKSAINPDTGVQVTNIAGLSCSDLGSMFTAIDVSVQATTSTTDDVYLVNGQTIDGFGGIIADATNSSIMGCSFSGKMKVTMGDGSNEDVFFGGLVGKAQKDSAQLPEEEEDEEEVVGGTNMLIMNSKMGLDQNSQNNQTKTGFEITVNTNGNAYIGLVVGDALNISLSNTTVGAAGNEEGYKRIPLNVSLNGGEPKAYIGGLAGKSVGTTIIECDTLNDIKLSGSTSMGDGNTTSGAFAQLGGLVGNYDKGESDTGIKQTNASANLTIEGLAIPSLTVAGGCAVASGATILNQCLLTGSIKCPEETGNNITTVYAGGAVAQSNGSLTLQEVMTDMNMIIGSTETKNIYAGGLVGDVKNPIILSSATIGRIVPINKYFSDTDNIYIGGIAGKVGIIKAQYVYSASSIITDGLDGKSLPNLYRTQSYTIGESTEPIEKEMSTINALIGVLQQDSGAGKVEELTSVYYSSDLSLSSDEHEFGVNYNAFTFYFDAGWKQDFTSGYGWKIIQSGSNTLLPLISSLETAMKTYAVMNADGTYKIGSVLMPEQETNNFVSTAYGGEFKYYLFGATSFVSSSDALNGILIGKDNEFSVLNLGTINKHSAVSNVHINLGNNATVSNNVLVGDNQGVIYNCSVQGTNITLSGTNVGLIANQNKGLVSHSYSSAEIIGCENGTGGIVGQNAGKINTCYFTGYIKNEENVLAGGIIAENQTGSGYAPFVYNCYMGGVVVNIRDNMNSLAGNSLPEANGLNNFIDDLASIDINSVSSDTGENKKYIISLIKTSHLMANQIVVEDNGPELNLKGMWHTTAEKQSAATDAKFILNKTTVGFGKNFCYPIIKFNRVDNQGDSLDVNYQANTGNGTPAANAGATRTYVEATDVTVDNFEEKIEFGIYTTTDNIVYSKVEVGATFNEAETYYYLVESSVEARAESIINGTDYENAFKIPHLGILTAIQGVMQKDENGVMPSLNFVLIHDVDTERFNESGRTWTAIGTSTGTNDFAGVDQFTGVFVSNQGMAHTTPVTGSELDAYCLITNLHGEGLFDNINDAYIGYLKLGNFFKMANSGALGKNVVGLTIVNQVHFATDSEITASETTTDCVFGGLFGKITKKDPSVANVTISNVTATAKFDGVNAAGGFVAGAMDAGTLKVVESEEAIKISLVNLNTFGGIIGKVNGSCEINFGSNTVEYSAFEGLVETFGGVIGKIADGVVTAYDFTVKFSSAVVANTFGGFIGSMDAGEFKNKAETSAKITLANEGEFVVYGTSPTNRYSGLICGRQGVTNDEETAASPAINVENFVVENIAKLTFRYHPDFEDAARISETETSQAVGTFVGYQRGNLTVKLGADNNKLLAEDGFVVEAKKLVNLGGIAGLFHDGETSIDNTIAKIKLIGKCNVGGAYGYIRNMPTFSEGSIYATDDETERVEIVVGQEEADGEYDTTNVYFNIGGLFGVMNTAVTLDENAILINKNSITIGYNANVKNVGGIAGKFCGDTAKNLQNLGSIKYIEGNAVNAEVINSAKSSDAEVNEFSRILNVGGVFGYIDVGVNLSVKISNISNSAGIQGYQNVGGLIGYANGNAIAISNEVLETGEESVNLEMTSSELPTDITFLGGQTGGQVQGVIDVGGLVGYLGGGATLKYFNTIASVYGNASVGGAVGYANNVNITNILVGNGPAAAAGAASLAEASQIEIKGVYYQYDFLDENDETKAVQYIPTSVGGFIGTAEKSIINHTILNGIKVGSAEEGSGVVINTNYNKMLNINIGSGNDNRYDNYVGLTENGPTVIFNELQSGFGGFIGTLDTSTIKGFENEKNNFQVKTTNNLKDITISAELGANVGIFYGYYGISDGTAISIDGENYYLLVPNLYSTSSMFVDGAYNIGAFVGFMEDKIGGLLLENISNSQIFGQAEIVVQNKLTGINVGGLFGKLISNKSKGFTLDNTTGTVQVYIDTNNSYNIGGLVGKLQITAENEFNEMYFAGEIDNGPTHHAGLDISHNIDNFGGLVGMLKLPESVNSTIKAQVLGTHKYHFTVCTIENSGYADGQSKYNSQRSSATNSTSTVETVEDVIELYAQATYVNQESFEISATSNSAYYSVSANNPITGTKGWAKAYTAFKTLQRCIPQSGNWNSLAVLYDASQVTHVGTVGNLGLTDKKVSATADEWQNAVTTAWNAGLSVVVNGVEYNQATGNSDIQELLNDAINNATEIKEPTGDAEKMSVYTSIKYIKQAEKGKSADLWTGRIEDNFYLNPYHICFTIYEQEPDIPTLYSAIGIASAYYDTSEVTEEQKNDPNYESNVYAKPESQTANAWQWILGFFINQTPPSLIFLDASKDSKGDANTLNYFKWKTSDGDNDGDFVSYARVDSGSATMKILEADGTEITQRKLVYFVKEYAGGDVTVDGKTGAYFMFDVVYENRSLGSSFNNSYLPNSGSIFEVTGLLTVAGSRSYHSENDTFGTVTKWIQIGIDVVLVVVSFGTYGVAAVSGAQAAKHAVKKVAKKTIKGFGKRLLTRIVAFGQGFAKHVSRKAARVGVRRMVAGGVAGAIGIMLNHTGAIWTNQINNYLSAYQYYIQPNSTNFGYVASSYSREIEYVQIDDDVWIIKGSSDKTIQDANGNMYRFYSSTRPGDFYSAYYVGHEVTISSYSPNDENIDDIEANTKLDFTGDTWYIYTAADIEGSVAGDVLVPITRKAVNDADSDHLYSLYYRDEDGFGYSSDLIYNDGSKNYSICKKYLYHDGMYYINALAGEVEYIETSLEFKPETYENGIGDQVAYEYPNYIENSNKIYVHGSWTGTGYTMDTELTQTDYQPYEMNRVVANYNASGDLISYTLNGATISENKVEKEETLNYVPTAENAEDLMGFKGYDYMQNAYYAVKGTSGLNLGGELVKYAAFTKHDGATLPAETQGVDWIYVRVKTGTTPVYNPTTGETEQIPVFSTVQYVFSEESTDPEAAEKARTASQLAMANNINDGDSVIVKVYPYSFINSYTINKDNAIHDNYTYKYSATEGLEHKATYYLYEGGYECYDYEEGVEHRVYLPVPHIVNGDGSWSYDLDMTEETVNESKIEISADPNATSGFEVTYSELVANWETYKNYKCLNYGEKVGDWFYANGSQLYMLSLEHALKDGTLHYVSIKYNSDELQQNFNENKYLTNNSVLLYTRYKYNGFANGNWGTYELIAEDGNINYGTKTVLVESVQVSLAGGKNLATGTTGTFIIK